MYARVRKCTSNSSPYICPKVYIKEKECVYVRLGGIKLKEGVTSVDSMFVVSCKGILNDEKNRKTKKRGGGGKGQFKLLLRLLRKHF